MATLELALTLAALAALLGAGLALLRGTRPTGAALAATLALAAIFAARWLVTAPSFVHASLHGPRLLNAAYDAPLAMFRNYGWFAGLAPGLAMHLFGANLTVVAALNQLFSVVTLAVMGWVAWRWTGSRAAALCVVAVAAFNPVLIRQGASEDGHPLAILLAWLAIAAMERHARDGRRAALVASAAAAVLMIQTRQVMLAFVPVIPLLGYLRDRTGAARRRTFWVAAAIPLAAALLRLLASAQEADQAGHVASIWRRLNSVDALAVAWSHNPIVDGRFALHLLPLYLIGAIWLWRNAAAGRFLVLAALYLFASSFWTYEGRNVALMFRLPALTVWLFIAGLGAWRIGTLIVRRWAPRVPATAVYAAIAALLCVAPAAQSGWAILSEVRPLTREYEYIRSMLPRLPREFTLVSEMPTGAGVPAYEFPYHLFEDAGVIVHRSGDRGPRLFLRGVYCRSYSLVELFGAQHGYELFVMPPEQRRRMFAAFGRTDSQGFTVPAEDRPECRRLLAGATPIGEPVRVAATPQDPPFVMFGVDAFDVQFYQLPPAP